MGGGSHPDLDSAPLHCSALITRHKGTGLMRHSRMMDSMTLFTVTEGVSNATKDEGTQHAARSKPAISQCKQQ